MTEQWFDVTPRSSAFEVHLSADGKYRHRPKLHPYGPEPTAEQRIWRHGRPPEARMPVATPSNHRRHGVERTGRGRPQDRSGEEALAAQDQNDGRGALHEAR